MAIWGHFDTFGGNFDFDTFKNDTFERVIVDRLPPSMIPLFPKNGIFQSVQILESVIIESASISAQCPNVPTIYIVQCILLDIIGANCKCNTISLFIVSSNCSMHKKSQKWQVSGLDPLL